MDKKELISLHGGHSSKYCNHAEDTLEDIIQKYIDLGYKKVGISEHIPPLNDKFLYPDEKQANLSVLDINKRFENYFTDIKKLKLEYRDRINIFAGLETETYTGYADHVKNLILKFQPDYIVGSVHHINDVCFDYSKEEYDSLALAMGSCDRMYEKYFNIQYEMIMTIKPFIVGHFDLIRIYDEDYRNRVEKPAVKQKILRNLELIKSMNLVMDFNLRPLARGEKEPYITASILKKAREMKIRVVPGDDSHSVKHAGFHVDKAITILETYGFDTLQWPDPVLLT